MIKLENVTYRYHDESDSVLRNISLEIQAGESVCIMGANGSGKSTFAKLVAGLIQEQQGRVRIDHEPTRTIPVGIIFQNPDNQMVAVTVEKEVAFGLENLGFAQETMERMVHDTLAIFAISHLERRLTTELSGGEKQRVALASVMILEPDILILDEPDSFLDERGKATLKVELERIRRQRPSMVLIHITQYPEAARQYRRLLVFHEGQIEADDTPERILSDYSFCVKTGLAFSTGEKKGIDIPSFRARKNNEKTAAVASIEFKQASFAYADDSYIIRSLNCALNAGQIVGVVGLSGSGKSTLAGLICNLLRLRGGVIVYADRTGLKVSPDRMRGRVSGIFQQPERQFFLPTCSEEITFGPKNLGRTLNKKEIESLLAMVGLEPRKFAERDPFTLSGGEKRRLAFAVVISMSPDFVVFDEPTCGLDQEGVGRFMLMAQALKEMGVGLVIISHDGNVISRLADRIIYLREGIPGMELASDEFFGNQELSNVVSPVTVIGNTA